MVVGSADIASALRREQQQQEPGENSFESSESKICTRPGCGKRFFETENEEGSCAYHNSMPIFHDGVKRWPCCGGEAWDWNDFIQIPGCARGSHTSEKTRAPPKRPEAAPEGESIAAKPPVLVRDIHEFNRQQENEKQEKESAANEKTILRPEVPYVTANGMNKCINKGCHKEYAPQDNGPSACSFHPGQPVFRDCMKSWTCCKAKSYDWDEFVQLAPCQKDAHQHTGYAILSSLFIFLRCTLTHKQILEMHHIHILSLSSAFLCVSAQLPLYFSHALTHTHTNRPEMHHSYTLQSLSFVNAASGIHSYNECTNAVTPPPFGLFLTAAYQAVDVILYPQPKLW